jgi:hypothetical protein
MKQNKRLFTIMLLLLPWLCLAQSNPSNLKPGDWFKVQLKLKAKLQSAYKPTIVDTLLGNRGQNQYDIRYEFTRQAADGHLFFNVTVERIKLKQFVPPNRWAGFDSYYPPYTQSNSDSIARPLFIVETDKAGKTIKVQTQQRYPDVTESEISPKKFVGNNIAYALDPFPARLLMQVSNLVTIPIRQGKIKLLNGTDITSLTNTNYKVGIIPVAASFAVPKNVVITGRITNTNKLLLNKYNHQPIKPLIFSEKDTFKINKDGTFKVELLVTGSSPVLLVYGDHFLTPFLSPGDSLSFTADAEHFEETLRYSNPLIFNSDFDKSYIDLSTKQSGYNPESILKMSAEQFNAFQDSGKTAFNNLVKRFKNKISATALDYYSTEWMYAQATAKLIYLGMRNFLYKPGATSAFEGYPKNFFASIDTLPVLMNNYESEPYYMGYFNQLTYYQNARLELTNGGQKGFLADYAVSLASLKGYALYVAIYKLLERGFQQGNYKKAQQLKPYYDDFMRNCGDTSFTNRLKTKWDKQQAWAPGKPSPLKELTLLNGQKLKLDKFKGKPLCIIFTYQMADDLKQFKGFIKKQDHNKVQVLIVQIVVPTFPKRTIDSAFLKLPNVTYVEVGADDDRKNTSSINIVLFEARVFVLDSWLRVVGDEFIVNPGNIKLLDDPVKKAIDTGKYTSRQKASFFKLLGWGLGTILAVFIGGYLIYKSRVNKIKSQEQVKRRMKELEIKAIRSQMNPHFIFNALNSIQYLINYGQYKDANIYLEKFAVLMRKVLNNSEKNVVSLADDLEAVTLYCDLEQLRFDFTFNLTIAGDIDTGLVEIPGMLIQPLVENAIIHGLAQKGKSGILTIDVSATDSKLMISVTDNGPGFSAGPVSNNSFGLKMVKERLVIPNSDEQKGELTIVNSPGGKGGAAVILTIPID